MSAPSIRFEYGSISPNGAAVVALTAANLVRARSLPMDESAVHWWPVHWRTTSFRRTTSVSADWICDATQTLQHPCSRFANDRKRAGNSRYQVYHLHPPGGPLGGLLLVGDGSRGSGKSQRRAPGRQGCRPLRMLLCSFRFIARVAQRSMVLIRCSLTSTFICIFCWFARLEQDGSPITPRPQI